VTIVVQNFQMMTTTICVKGVGTNLIRITQIGEKTNETGAK